MTEFVITSLGRDRAADNEELVQWLKDEPGLRTAASLGELRRWRPSLRMWLLTMVEVPGTV